VGCSLSLVYFILFLINGFLVYRGIADILKDIPLSKFLGDDLVEIVGFILGGLFGLSIEIAIGSVLFVKFSLKWFCDSKMKLLLRQMRSFGRSMPVQRSRVRGQITLCRDIFSDYLRISFSFFDTLLVFFCFVGLGIDAIGAKRTVEEAIKQIFKDGGRNFPDDLTFLDALNYVPALLPVAMIIIISIVLGYLVYFPKELNNLLDRFNQKIDGFDREEILYLIECNNELCEYISRRLDDLEKVDEKEIKRIQLQHEINYLKEKRNRVLSAHDWKQVELNQGSESQDNNEERDWANSIDKIVDDELVIDLKGNALREEARLKVRFITQRIRSLLDELNKLNNKDKIQYISSQESNGSSLTGQSVNQPLT
jgi:hypothetical protein